MLRHLSGTRRVVITGIGCVTPIGVGREAFWTGLRSGSSGVRKIGSFADPRCPVRIAAEVRDLDPRSVLGPKDRKHVPRTVPLVLSATAEALADAQIDTALFSTAEQRQTGVVMGTGGGGLAFTERHYSYWYLGGRKDASVYVIPASTHGGLARLGSDPERFLREVVMANPRAAEVLADAQPVSRWLAVPIPAYGRRDPAPVLGMLAIGDAAGFIDPFTGSGILLALESAKLAAEVLLSGRTAGLSEIQAVYQDRYAQDFTGRLRASSLLRLAASSPTLAAMAVSLLGVSQNLMRRAAQATRAPDTAGYDVD